MRILIVSQYFWPENFRINDLAVGLIDKGYDVSVLTGLPNYPEGKFYNTYNVFGPKYEIYKKIKIYRSFIIPRGSGGKIQLFLNYLSFAVFGSLRMMFLSKNKYDLVFVHEPSPITVGLPAIVLKKIKKVPIAFWVMDLWPESVEIAGGIKSKFIFDKILSLVKYIYDNSDKILVTSKAFIPSITEKGIDEDKISYLPQWAESVFKSRISTTSKYQHLFPNGFKIVFAGNIGESQDFESIINAAELIKGKLNVQWIIIGGGRRKQWVKNQIKVRKLEKIFHLIGKYEIYDMPDLYSNADALLISLKKSKIFSLTIPAKIQSYLACGKPILSMMDGEGSRIINESKSGFTAPAEDPMMLSKNIKRMIDMTKKELSIFGFNGRKYYQKNFERKIIIKKLEDIFSKLNNINK